MKPQMEIVAETHGEFTLETDELRVTVPRVCFTKLHMQETEQNRSETTRESPERRQSTRGAAQGQGRGAALRPGRRPGPLRSERHQPRPRDKGDAEGARTPSRAAATMAGGQWEGHLSLLSPALCPPPWKGSRAGRAGSSRHAILDSPPGLEDLVSPSPTLGTTNLFKTEPKRLTQGPYLLAASLPGPCFLTTVLGLSQGCPGSESLPPTHHHPSQEQTGSIASPSSLECLPRSFCKINREKPETLYSHFPARQRSPGRTRWVPNSAFKAESNM